MLQNGHAIYTINTGLGQYEARLDIPESINHVMLQIYTYGWCDMPTFSFGIGLWSMWLDNLPSELILMAAAGLWIVASIISSQALSVLVTIKKEKREKL